MSVIMRLSQEAEETLQQLNKVLSFIPKELCEIIVNYGKLLEILFDPTMYRKVLSKSSPLEDDNRTLTVCKRTDEIGSLICSVPTQHPFAITPLKWTFHIACREYSLHVAVGIELIDENKCMVKSYSVTRIHGNWELLETIPNNKNVGLRLLTSNPTPPPMNSYVEMEAHLDHGSVSVTINNTVFKDCFREIHDLQNWRPYVRTYFPKKWIYDDLGTIVFLMT